MSAPFDGGERTVALGLSLQGMLFTKDHGDVGWQFPIGHRVLWCLSPIGQLKQNIFG